MLSGLDKALLGLAEGLLDCAKALLVLNYALLGFAKGLLDCAKGFSVLVFVLLEYDKALSDWDKALLVLDFGLFFYDKVLLGLEFPRLKPWGMVLIYLFLNFILAMALYCSESASRIVKM